MAKKPTSNKNVVFTYEGVDRQRNPKKGDIAAPNMGIARAQLRQQGITVKKIKKKPKPLFSSSGKAIKPADIAAMSRQLSTMLQAGVPIIQSFDIIIDGSDNPNMKTLMRDIKTEVEAGGTFADALRKHPKYFDDLFCDLVHAGEQSGSLEGMMDRIATYKEKTEALKSKIKKAMFYPTAVMIVAFIVTAILLIFVVPQFQSLFQGAGADLPAFTQMIIDLSDFMQSYWYIVFGSIIAAVFAFKYSYTRSEALRDAIDKISLKAPVAGSIINKAAIARFARTLSTTFAAGVPLVEAMDSAAGASGNVVYRNAILSVKNDVSTGMQMNLAMKSTEMFPNMVVQMVAIGEESGAIEDMLAKVADIYEREVDDAVDALSSLLEPMIMAILGVLVGGLVVGMYLPIFQLGNAF